MYANCYYQDTICEGGVIQSLNTANNVLDYHFNCMIREDCVCFSYHSENNICTLNKKNGNITIENYSTSVGYISGKTNQ